MLKQIILVGLIFKAVSADTTTLRTNTFPTGNFSNATNLVNDDVVAVRVNNFGNSSIMTTFSVYLDENTQLNSFNADRSIKVTSKVKDNFLNSSINPESLPKAENKVACTKLLISNNSHATFDFSYNVINGNNRKKNINKFILNLQLTGQDPRELNVILSSANYNFKSYPSNSKHTWIVQCHDDYSFNFKVTSIQIETEFDSLTLFDVSTENPRKLITEVSGLGTIKTNTNNLLVVFRSDCDSSFAGFRAVLKAVENYDTVEITSASMITTKLPEYTKNALGSTKNPDRTTHLYDTTELNTTFLENTSADKTTTFSTIETTLEILGKGQSCKKIKRSDPKATTGLYLIEMEGENIKLVCDMDISGGGWAVFQYRFQGTIDFVRNWTSYEQGFGDLNAEFWLGLKNLNKLTSSGLHDLRIEMSSFDGRNKFAEYKNFKVADYADNYRLSFEEDSYSGDAGDALKWHNNMQFSTFDVDNDFHATVNCSSYWGGNGGNWYYYCANQSMSGKYGGAGDEGRNFMFWYYFDGNEMALQKFRWMVREAV